MKKNHRNHLLFKLQRQSGFTLLELMIALFIGVLLLTGVIQIYASSKQAYRSQEASGQLQDLSRFVIDSMSRQLRYAGMRNSALLSFDDSFPVIAPNALPWPNTWPNTWQVGFGAGTTVVGQDDVDGNGIPQDRLYFRSQAYSQFGSALSGCSGQDIGSSGQVFANGNLGNLQNIDGDVVPFSWSAYYVDGQNRLNCLFNGTNNIITDNVLGLDILYRVDVSNIRNFPTAAPKALMTATQINTYNQTIAGVPTPPPPQQQFQGPRDLWQFVTGVQLNFLIQSNNQLVATDNQPINFQGVITTPQQQQLYRTFSISIMLRNASGENMNVLLL